MTILINTSITYRKAALNTMTLKTERKSAKLTESAGTISLVWLHFLTKWIRVKPFILCSSMIDELVTSVYITYNNSSRCSFRHKN